MISNRLAICSWSLLAKSSRDLVEQVGRTGIKRVQLALNPLIYKPEFWYDAPERLENQGYEIVSAMFGTVGEDYTSPDTIRQTGGVVPDETWDENWKHTKAVATLAKKLNLKNVTFHAGFIPENMNAPAFEKLLCRIRRIADLFGDNGLTLGFETGQETAETLNNFLSKLDRENIGVNFDPANMILYNKGDPIKALSTLRHWLCQCHIKDAIAADQPGVWGREVPVGQGEVNWCAFFRVLDQIGFKGYLAIEREHRETRVKDIKAARAYLENLSEKNNG